MVMKVCTSELMISDINGVGMARAYFPQIVKEAFLTSNKDGEIKRSPDPVTMIDGDLAFFNNNDADLQMWVMVHRAPRSIVSTSPVTVLIHDAWSFDVGVNPQAEYPSVYQDTFGGKLQLDKASVSGEDLKYGRFFLNFDDSQAWEPIGIVKSQQALHFRYLAAVHTPGVWTEPTEKAPRYEANANWCRLQAFAVPVGGA